MTMQTGQSSFRTPENYAESGFGRGVLRTSNPSSLYSRSILFAALACMVLLALDIRQIWTARDACLQQVRTNTDNLARSLAQHAEDVFETADSTLQSLRTTVIDDGVGPDSIARLDRRMRVSVSTRQFLRGEFVFDEHGNWLATSLPANDFEKVRNANYADRTFFRFHRDHPEDIALVGPPIQTKVDGVWVVTLSRRLNHPDGSFAGVVDTSIDLDLFQKFFNTFAIGAHGAIILTSGDGQLLVRRPAVAANIGRDVSQGELFRQIEENTQFGSFEYTALLDHTRRIGSFRRVPGFDLIMIVALDRDETLAGWAADTRTQLAWMAAIVGMVVVLGWRLTIQIRDRVAAESLATKLQIEAEGRQRSAADLAALNGSIARSEARFRQLVESAPNAMLMVNETGLIEMVNAQAELLFGYQRSALLGAAIEMLIPPTSRAGHPALRTEFTAHPTARPMGAGRALFGRRQDGSEVELEIALSPIETDGGPKILSVIVDISERVRLEAELRQSQKLDAIGKVAAGVAHDFNNLLQALGGSLELLLGEVADRPVALEWGEVALRAAARGNKLTDRLLSFSRKQNLTPRPILIADFLAELQDLISHLFELNAKARTELVVEPCQPDLTVQADHAQLQAALINLAVNARDAMVSGGSLRISAYASQADLQIVPPGHYTVISVADTGSGMDAATMKQAFEPFFTTKGPDGTGLGLSMVHGFARQSGGAAHITSTLGGGTTIDLWLPRTFWPAMITAPPSSPPRPRDGIITNFAMPGMNGPELPWRAGEIDTDPADQAM